MTEVQRRVAELLATEFGLAGHGLTTPIFSTKILDSMDVLRLIFNIEDVFSIKIKTFEVSLEMFDTIESISQLIEDRL